MNAEIGTEGEVAEVSLASGDPSLAKAAIKSAKKWEYEPYLLQGRPVEVEATILMNFVLSGNQTAINHALGSSALFATGSGICTQYHTSAPPRVT